LAVVTAIAKRDENAAAHAMKGHLTSYSSILRTPAKPRPGRLRHRRANRDPVDGAGTLRSQIAEGIDASAEFGPEVAVGSRDRRPKGDQSIAD
jgi:hypothetical protein